MVKFIFILLSFEIIRDLLYYIQTLQVMDIHVLQMTYWWYVDITSCNYNYSYKQCLHKDLNYTYYNMSNLEVIWWDS